MKRKEYDHQNEKRHQYMEAVCKNNPCYGKKRNFVADIHCNDERFVCDVWGIFGIVDEKCG